MWEQKKRRFAAWAIVVIIIFIAFVSCGSQKKQNQTQDITTINTYPKYKGVSEYEVEVNDTLLGIAVKMCPHTFSSQDYYRYADDIRRLNGRKTDIIYWHEKIKIYVFDERSLSKYE